MTRGLIEILEDKVLKNIPGGQTRPEGYTQCVAEREYKWKYKLDETEKLPLDKQPIELRIILEAIKNSDNSFVKTNGDFAKRMKEAYKNLSDDLHARILKRLQGLPYDYEVAVPESQGLVIKTVMKVFRIVKIPLPKIPS